MPNLVRQNGNAALIIQFQCYECNKIFITSFDNFSKSYTCSKCGARVNTLPLFCNNKECQGRYEKCDGVIYKLTETERGEEEKKAFESELDITVGARPTSSFHDDIGDIRGTIPLYKCSRCGDSYTALQANGKGFDTGHVRCQRIICSSCRHFPKLEELPAPDSNADNTPLNLFVER